MVQFRQHRVLQLAADAGQLRLDGLFCRLQFAGDFADGTVCEILLFDQFSFIRRQRRNFLFQQNLQPLVGAMVVCAVEFDFRVPRESFQKRKVTAALSGFVGERAARQNGKPAPKHICIGEDSNVPRHAHQGRLQHLARGVFVAGGDDQQVTPQAVEVSIIKSAPGHFISFRHRTGQRGHVQRFARTFVRGRGTRAGGLNVFFQADALTADGNLFSRLFFG